ncbi:MAG: TonB-dependent receptor [Candidatus Angelobacter sp.]|nr:TonB-dependent receptor [Candidatus Angelobacter sp.]
MKMRGISLALVKMLSYVTVLVLVFSSQMVAQSARARIVGTVKDPQGAVVIGAAVTVTNVATGVESKTTTDHEGFYQAFELPIGSYRVKVQREGFNTSETVPYTLEINQVQRIDVTLRVGTKAETIEVTGDAAQVEVVNPTIGASITSRPIVDLPLNGRNVLDLALLEPGVTPHNNDDGGAGTYNIAGSRADSVTFLLDGGVDNNLLSNGVVYTPNPDAVQEFRILTSNYTAEYGRNAGGIVSVVTKSGGNQVHGSVFEFNRNDAFSANTYFNKKNGLPRDPLKRNQYGFAVGGPIKKDKLFWFASYQGQKQTAGLSRTISTFTPEMLTGNFSHAGPGGTPDANVVTFLQNNPFYQPNAGLAALGIIDPSRIDSVAKNYISKGLIAVAPNNAVPGVCDTFCSGTLNAQGNNIDNFNEFTARLDYNLTERDHLNGTLGGRRFNQTRPLPVGGPGFPTVTIPHNYFSGLTYTRTFSPALLNEFHFTMQRNAQDQAVPSNNLPTPAQLGVGVTPDQSTGPTRLGFSSGLVTGFSPQGPTKLINNTFSYADTFTWVRGRHTWKFGASYTPYQNNTVFDFFVDGQFDFDEFNGAFNPYANFLLGLPEDYFQFGSAPSNIRQKSTYFFVQDEWHVRKNLVLTLGTRYEFSSPKIDTQGRSFSIVPGAQSTRFVNAPVSLLFPGDAGAPKGANFSDKNDWAPRVGFAWDPKSDGKTSIRGGGGIFYDVLKGEDNLQFNGQAPFFGFTSPVFTDCPNAVNSGDPGCVTGPTGFMSDPFATTGTPNPFPSKAPAKNIDFGAAGFLPFGGGGVFFVNPHLRTPYTVQYNLDIQRELARNMALEVGYLGSQSRKLTTLIDINAFDPATLSSANRRRFLNENGAPDDLRFSFTDEFENAVNANYNALQTKISKKATSTPIVGTTYFTLAYTWSHTIDNSSGFRNRNSQIPFFQRNVFRTSSDFDIRHQLSFSGGWDLPFDHAWASGPKRLTQGWSLFPIISWHTGFPLDVLANLSTRRTRPGPSGAGDSGLVFATLTGPITYNDPHRSTPGTTGNQYFNGSSFSSPSDTVITGSYGSGRNILRGPGRTNFDVALAKATKITERTALQVRAEFFNLFNRAQFLEPDTNISSGTFGQVTTTYPARVIQFGGRFTF